MKIATCCHCGTKATLRFDKGQHTLSCAACGAPLRQMKQIKTAPAAPAPAMSHQPAAPKPHRKAKARHKPKKRVQPGRWLRKFAEEAFDLVEDIFD